MKTIFNHLLAVFALFLLGMAAINYLLPLVAKALLGRF